MNRLILVAVAYVLASCHDRHTLTSSFEGLTNDTLLVYGWPVASRPESALPRCDTTLAASGLAEAASVPPCRIVTLHKLTDFRHLIESRKKVRTSVPMPDDNVVPPNWDSLESYYVSLVRYVGRLFTRPIEEIRDRREASERTARENRTRTVPGTPAPPLRLPTIYGGDFSLDFNRGECTVLHFWTSRCQPCTDDFPDMKRAWDRYHDRVYFISIGCGESRQVWKKAVRRYALPWLNLYDDARTNVSARYGVETYPTKFIIDRAGIILEREDDDPSRFYIRLDSIMTAQQPLAAQ